MLYYERNISRMEPPFLMRKDKLYVLLCSISTKASPLMVNAQARIQFSNALFFNRHLGLMINSTGTLGQSNGLWSMVRNLISFPFFSSHFCLFTKIVWLERDGIIFSHDYNRKRRCEWKLHTVQKMEVFIDSYCTHYVKNARICFLLFFLNLVLCSCSRAAFVDLQRKFYKQKNIDIWILFRHLRLQHKRWAFYGDTLVNFPVTMGTFFSHTIKIYLVW